MINDLIDDFIDAVVAMVFITIFSLLGWFFFDEKISFYDGLAMFLVLQIMIQRSKEGK